jgi:hypothetical protein
MADCNGVFAITENSGRGERYKRPAGRGWLETPRVIYLGRAFITPELSIPGCALISARDAMKYAYENLGDEQFETLIIFLCQRLLGIAVQGFSKGKDGGRDAKFVGTAELHPSKASPWRGTTIIQAKHTNGYNKNFSETDFYNPKPDKVSILSEEIPRIKKLRDGKELDNYMLFANRRLAGNAESVIVAYISDKTGVPKPSIYLCGLEQLETWMKTFPDVATNAKLELVDSPLIVSPDELAEVVQAFAEHKATIDAVLDHPPTDRVSYDKKNTITPTGNRSSRTFLALTPS